MSRFPVFALLALTLAATPLPAAQADELRFPAAARPAVSLVWFDPTGALPVPAQVVAAEVAALFAAWDIDVRWRVGEAGITITEPPEISVVVQPERHGGHPEILGEVEPGQDPRAAWVSVAAVARVLDRPYAPGRRLGGDVAHEFATAIARVVTHEIAHLAAPELPHTSQGLMRRSLRRIDLLHPAPILEGGKQQTFRARIAAFAADIAA
jgi:hypothetical protein